MGELREQLIRRRKQLLSVITQKELALQNVPEGSLRVVDKKFRTEYYHRASPSDRNGVYIPNKDFELRRGLAQKDYDEKVLDSAKEELKGIQYVLKHYPAIPMELIYEALHPKRQALITPIKMPDFCTLKLTQRKEILWEHLGMMSNEDYSSRQVNKILAYQNNGYFIGDNLIITMETKKRPLLEITVEQIITHYFE